MYVFCEGREEGGREGGRERGESYYRCGVAMVHTHTRGKRCVEGAEGSRPHSECAWPTVRTHIPGGRGALVHMRTHPPTHPPTHLGEALDVKRLGHTLLHLPDLSRAAGREPSVDMVRGSAGGPPPGSD